MAKIKDCRGKGRQLRWGIVKIWEVDNHGKKGGGHLQDFPWAKNFADPGDLSLYLYQLILQKNRGIVSYSSKKMSLVTKFFFLSE